MGNIYQWAALGAAVSWALGSIWGAVAVRHMGTFAFNRARLTIAPLILLPIVVLRSADSGVDWDGLPIVLLSGIVGLFLGDAVLFAAVRRIGPRRTAVLFSTNAPMTALLGAWFLGESLALQTWIGVVIVALGVILAIIFGKRKSQLSIWEEITPPLWVGIVLGLAGALGQAVGSIIIRPVMAGGADPLFVSMMRTLIAAAAFWAIFLIAPDKTRVLNPMTRRIWGFSALNAIAGMVIGVTLIMFAFSGAKAGVAATLSATTPVIMLPILWFSTREIPALGAWVGAALVVVGSALIFMV